MSGNWRVRVIALRSDRPMPAGERRKRVRLPVVVMPPDVDGESLPRPRNYEDCRGGPRPCPIVSCPRNLYLDVTETGSIRLNQLGLEPWEVDPERSCVGDITAGGDEMTLDEIGKIFSVSRERVRQIETIALLKKKARLASVGITEQDFLEHMGAKEGENKP